MRKELKPSTTQTDTIQGRQKVNGRSNGVGGRPYLVRIAEAASITGLPASLIRKSFMCATKKPANVPEPPPHKRIGKAIYIIADRLEDWVSSLGQTRQKSGNENFSFTLLDD